MPSVNFFRPKPTLTEAEIERGLRLTTYEGIASMGFGSIAGSGFLAAYALALGANNLQIGLLAALPFIVQPLQIPLVLVVERVKNRKLLAVTSWFVAQAIWLPIASIPFFIDVPSAVSISALLGLMALRSVMSTVTNANRNGWIRDLVPSGIRGSYMSRRLSYATVGSIVFGLAASGFVDLWQRSNSPEEAVFGYAIAILFGAIFLGLASPVLLAFTPEPLMQDPVGERPSILGSLSQPMRDANFRRLLTFLFVRGFITNLALPFFAVYMLQKIGLPLVVVISLTVLSQLFNVLFLRVWGPMADRLGSKAVLSVCTSLLHLVILGWTFTTLPGPHTFTIPLLVALHIFAGVANAGINVATATLGMKLAPERGATAFLTANSLAVNLGAGIAPLIGGYFADFFDVRSFQINVEWISPDTATQLPAFSLTGYDFLFLIAFLLGPIALSALGRVHEEGEVETQVVMDELTSNSQEMARVLTAVPGMRFALQIPYSQIRRVPGAEVAAGVTIYQIAESTRAAATVASRGTSSAQDVAGGISNTITRAVRDMQAASHSAADIALHATRGSMNALHGESMGRIGTTTRGAIIGAMRALGTTSQRPLRTLRGAARGAVRGAHEADLSVTDAALHAVEAARLSAVELGLPTDLAVENAIESILIEAEAIGDEEHQAVQEVLNAAQTGSATEDQNERTS